jgi:hypothetical protein
MTLKSLKSIPAEIVVKPDEFINSFNSGIDSEPNIHEFDLSKKNQIEAVSYLSFRRLCLADATAHIHLLTDIIRSKSNLFSKLKAPIFFDGYWFDGNVESLDPEEVESISFFVNEELPGVKDGNRIISIYSKKAKTG